MDTMENGVQHSRMHDRYSATNTKRIGKCKVMVRPEGLSLTFSVRWNN